MSIDKMPGQGKDKSEERLPPETEERVEKIQEKDGVTRREALRILGYGGLAAAAAATIGSEKADAASFTMEGHQNNMPDTGDTVNMDEATRLTPEEQQQMQELEDLKKIQEQGDRQKGRSGGAIEMQGKNINDQ